MITKQHLSIKNYKQVASCFHCLAPRTSDDMFDVDNTENLEEVSKTLTNMCREDIDVLNIKGCHSKSCIMHYFPIIPTCARPFLTNKDESFDNNLTCQLSEIMKANNLVKKFLSSGMKPNEKNIQRLVFRINTYYVNGKKKSRHSASGYAYEGISDILKRKGGHIRKHLCGKRVNQGARTVLGGDPSLKIDQVGIPKDICKVLTKPMFVNSLNYDQAEKLIREKTVNYIQKGERKISLKFHKLVIDIGDILHVHLMEGDWVVMNRERTLHRPSMMRFQVVPQDTKTFNISLAVTKPLNADFDGDEINCHVPQNPMVTTEVKELMATPFNILSPKNGMPIICIVQDAMVSMYLLTKRKKQIERSMFMQYLVDIDDLSRFNEIASKLGYKGKALFSFTKAVVAQNDKDTDRKWIVHGWNDR